MATTKVHEKKLTTVPLDWSEVYYTNCPLVSASNVDQELGWTKEEYKKIGVNYFFLRARAENDCALNPFFHGPFAKGQRSVRRCLES